MLLETIKSQAEHRKIPFLVHFTRTANLPSILERGLYPRTRHQELSVSPVVNDALRLDNHLDANCVSIGFPNNPMFYRFRNDTPNIDWAVLTLDRSILWTKRCAFCRHNAADGRIRHLPLSELMTPAAFAGLFQEPEGANLRSEQQLHSFDPTDVQAEVLVFDVIEPSLVLSVVVDNLAAKRRYEHLAAGKRLEIHRPREGFFATRSYNRRLNWGLPCGS